MAETISSDAQSVLANATPSAVSYVTQNAPGKVATSGEAKALLAKYGIDPNNTLSATNINQTINNPTPAPDDLLGIRNQLSQQLGVGTSQEAFTAAQKAYMDAQNALDTALTGISGRTVSMSKITGERAQASQVAQGNIENLMNAATIAQNTLQAKQQELATQFGIRESEVQQKQQIMWQYPGAKISFADSTEQVASKLSSYQKQVEKDTYKASLKAKALDLGLKTSGNSKKLEKRISKANKSALKDVKEEHDLKMESMKMDIANVKSQISERGKSGNQKSISYTEPEQRILANDLLKEAESKGLYGNYAYEYVVKEGGKLGMDTGDYSPFVNSLRSNYGIDQKYK